MAKSDPQPDVLVLGEHPSAYLAAALLRQKSKTRVLHATLPDERLPGRAERLVVVNPALFGLHKLLEPLRRRLEMASTYGIQFLGPEPDQRSEHRSRSIVAHVAPYKEVRAGMIKLAEDQGVELAQPKQVEIHRLDEQGLEVTVGRATIHPRVLILAGILPDDQQRLLGMPESWGEQIVHRYSFVRLNGSGWADLGARPTIPMSLDLNRALHWGWLLPGPRHMQLAVSQPAESLREIGPRPLLGEWAELLRQHEVIRTRREIPLDAIESIDLPLAGALAHEGVANRTLLIGPAGGFYSASGEETYPACWSAIYAADVLRKALKEPHLQDALQPYRHRWRTTLGEYLRGPQQNLRFLLPLVYRNQVMTDRLAESILRGTSMIR